MILKSSYQQVVIVVSRDELTDMLLGQPGFEIEKIEDNQSEVHFIFGRKTDHDLSLPSCVVKKLMRLCGGSILAAHRAVLDTVLAPQDSGLRGLTAIR